MSNVAQIIDATRKPQHAFAWTNGSLAATITGTLVNTGISGLNRRYAPFAGSVYALAASLSGTLTSGTITLTPQIDGTPQPSMALVIGTAGVKGGVKSQDARKTWFNVGSTLEILYTTAAALAGGMAIEAELHVMFEAVEL